MKIVILGAGVIGVTAAYVLGSRGHEVEVIERAQGSGLETTFANGGQLSFSHAEPWANPATLAKVLPWLFHDDAPLVLRPRADLAMLSWGLRFLANCTTARARANSVNILRLGLYSKKQMEILRHYSGVQFDNRREGILHIFSSQKAFDHALEQARFQKKWGCPAEAQDLNACIQLEPMLAHAGKPLVGGILQPLDESGDAHLFSANLATQCEREHKTVFHYGTRIERLEQEKGRITGIVTDKGKFIADAYILSLGAYSPLLLKPLGIHVPIYPMKGYSLTFPATHYTPHLSLTDGEHKIVYSRIGERLRVAGTAEFAGYDTSVKKVRVNAILRAVQNLFPEGGYRAEAASEWACLRPSTPDGPPIIGKTPYPNLYLNTGHGTLGWTQAAGSASLIADIIEDRSPEISLDGLTLDRY